MTTQDHVEVLAALIAERAVAADRPGAFLVGIAGGVAVGKSTLARALADRLAEATPPIRVQIVATDGFLRPNAELAVSGLTGRKGFPESYDTEALDAFLATLAAGRTAEIPVYSHISYDIVPDETRAVEGAGVVIVEGINVLQTAAARSRLDLAVYVDAACEDMHAWYLRRLDEIVTNEPQSLIAQIKDPEQRRAIVEAVWRDVNLVNLRDHIAPTEVYAAVVVRKGSDHSIVELVLR